MTLLDAKDFVLFYDSRLEKFVKSIQNFQAKHGINFQVIRYFNLYF